MYAHEEIQWAHIRFVWPFSHSPPKDLAPYLTPILDTLVMHLNSSALNVDAHDWADAWSDAMGMPPPPLGLSPSLSPFPPFYILLSFLSLA